jgi:transcriptional regulator with XRE-family HTH domain
MSMARLERSWKEIRQDLLRTNDFRKAYEELEPEFQTARAIIALRAAKGLTQEQMAAKAGIQRPMLSRLEGAKDLPTLPTLARLAAAIGAKVQIHFVDRKNRELPRVPPIRVASKPAAAMRERIR